MEYDVKIRHGLGGKVEIIDLSRDCKQYYDEESEFVPNLYKYRYTDCVTINIISKVTTTGVTFLDALVNNHFEFINEYKYAVLDDVASFTLSQDGYYQVTHLTIPVKEWVDECLKLEKKPWFLEEAAYTIYCIDGDKLLKYHNGKYLDATIEEIMLVNNPDINNLQKVYINLFYLGFLQECYMDYCKEVFDKMTQHCRPSCKPADATEARYARDFLFSTLAILKYLVEGDFFLEAQRILEDINYCGGYCKNATKESTCECGCHTRSLGCGCGQA